MINFLNFILMFLTKAHDGFWAITGNDSNMSQDYCDIKWRLYQTCSTEVRYIEYCVEDGLEMFSSGFYNMGTEQLVLLGLPFSSDFAHKNVVPMVEALVGRCDINLIALDNTIHTNPESISDYPRTMLQVYKDSKRYAKVLNEALMRRMFSPYHMTGLGFSLGAQQVGQICRRLHTKCGHILAVDPAGPLYLPREMPLLQNFPHLHLVSREDACHVVFVECNRWLMGSGLRTAHENIQVNNGMFQPTCFPGNVLCSHEFCNKLVINTIYSSKPCRARTRMRHYNTLEETVIEVPLQKETYNCESQESKVFFLKTSQKQPICQED